MKTLILAVSILALASIASAEQVSQVILPGGAALTAPVGDGTTTNFGGARTLDSGIQGTGSDGGGAAAGATGGSTGGSTSK